MAENITMKFDGDEFLGELTSDSFVPPPPPQLVKQQEREMKALIKSEEKQRKLELKQSKIKIKPSTKASDDDSIFGDESTPIVGRDKLVLLKKVKQWKSLFPDELKSFKIKRNPSVEDLENSLAEMAVIVETGGIDGFMMDSVIQCIRMIEGVSSSFEKYDIRGCADLLKSNKQFHSLCKQLFIKYNVFSSVPVEYQLIMLVSTTAFIVNQKNRNKGQLNSYLDEKV